MLKRSPFKKGYKQTIEHQRNAKKARYAENDAIICIGCKKEILKYNKDTLTCGALKCRKKLNILKYKTLSKSDKLQFKALKLFSTIRLGKGKKEKAIKILNESLGKKCNYCEVIITLDNASVDHKEPRTGSKVFDRKKKKMIYSYEEIKELDKEENLQIICRNCNQNKGNMTDKEFSILLGFLNNYLELKNKLFHRLKMARLFFGRKN